MDFFDLIELRTSTRKFTAEQIIANVSNRDELLTEGLDFDPFYDAPTVIFISHKKQDLELGIEFCDVACVANYMQLAALNLGLGSCFMWYALDSMRRLPEYDHTDLLHLPEDFEPLLGLAIGVPKEPLTAKEIDFQRIKID